MASLAPLVKQEEHFDLFDVILRFMLDGSQREPFQDLLAELLDNALYYDNRNAIRLITRNLYDIPIRIFWRAAGLNHDNFFLLFPPSHVHPEQFEDLLKITRGYCRICLN